MSAPYYQKIDYSERLPKYKNWSQYEWDLKNTFSYDDYFGFSDLRIFKIQNSHRIDYMWDDFGITRDSHLSARLSTRTGGDTDLFKDISAVINASGIHRNVFWKIVIQEISSSIRIFQNNLTETSRIKLIGLLLVVLGIFQAYASINLLMILE